MRFGTNCFSDSEAYNKIIDIIKKFKENKMVFVVSALPEVTELLNECTTKANRKQDLTPVLQAIQNKHNQIIHSIFSEYQVHLLEEFLQDNLEKIKEKLDDIKEFGLSPYKRDFVLSFGELFSAYILSNFLLINDYFR